MIKTTNYQKLANVNKSPYENASRPRFLWTYSERDSHKFSNVDPDSPEGELILKDWFITHSDPDIRRKL